MSLLEEGVRTIYYHFIEKYLERTLPRSLQQNLGQSAKVHLKGLTFETFSLLPWYLRKKFISVSFQALHKVVSSYLETL